MPGRKGEGGTRNPEFAKLSACAAAAAVASPD